MTESKQFKMSITRAKKTGIILERELSTDEVFNELVYYSNNNKQLKNENKQLLEEKIDAETKLYKANEQLLMQMDYDNLCKENQDMEFELIKIKKENEQLKKENERLQSIINVCRNTKDVYSKKIMALEDKNEALETLYQQMSYYFKEDQTLNDLDDKDFARLQRLAKGLVD